MSANRRRESPPRRASASEAQARAPDLLRRNAPVQQRSVARNQAILDATARLLDDVGFEAINTIMIARMAGISVGTLYHYFPNKHAILFAMASEWVEDVERALEEIGNWPLRELGLADFVDRLIERQLSVYRSRHGILHLVQAMFSVPELRQLDQRHDELVISHMSRAFSRFGLRGSEAETGRIARAYLELTHALLLVVVNQAGVRSRRTLADLKRLTVCLLEPHLESGDDV